MYDRRDQAESSSTSSRDRRGSLPEPSVQEPSSASGSWPLWAIRSRCWQTDVVQVSFPEGDALRSVRKGERLVRYFQEGDRTYAGTLEGSPIYGFVRLPASERRQTWDIARSAVTDGPVAIPPRVLAAVRENIEEVNRVYQVLYGYFNKQTGAQRPVPRWRMSRSQRTIVCTLANRPAGADLSQSTRYLFKDLENALLGTPLKVSGTPDRIEIRMEQAE